MVFNLTAHAMKSSKQIVPLVEAYRSTNTLKTRSGSLYPTKDKDHDMNELVLS